MFIALILFILLLILMGAIAHWVGKSSDKTISRNHGGWVIATWITAGLTVIVLLLASITTVSTRNVGIVTTFGRTSGHLDNGLHVIAPWDNVTEMNAAIQTDSYVLGTKASTSTNDSNSATGPCVNVRIANQQTACVDVSIKWRINPSAADELFQNYHDFSTVQDSLVHRELNVALNNQLSDYNPLNSITEAGSGSFGSNPTLTQVGAKVTEQMRRELAGQIEVISTLIPILHYDGATENRINQIQQQVAQTRIADAQLQTNQAQSAANAALAQSVTTPVLESKCLDIMKEMVQNGQKVPAGMTCGLGSNVTGIIAGS